MNVQRFSGANSREAMQKVKAVLGDDALIVGNRTTDYGIEILAALDSEISDGDGPAAAALPEPAAPQDDIAVGASPADVFPVFQALSEPAPAVPVEGRTGKGGVAPSPVREAVIAPDPGFSERLMAEVRDVKNLLATSTARLQGSDSNGRRIHGTLLSAGFSEELAAELSLALPDALQLQPWGSEIVREWLERQLTLRLPEQAAGEALVDAGGIFALVGPTGSGKTTTTAKIAAQYVMRHGPEDIALVSTDYYRIGAHEQLREYSGLLDVTFRAVEEGQSLAEVLEHLAHKKVVLIDTVGLSQRDERVLDQFSELGQASVSLTCFLLLSGSSHQQTLEEVVHSYRRSARNAGVSIDHCILTKLDEAFSPALLLDKIICHSLRPVFTTSGQRVPEDIEKPQLASLVTHAVEGALQATTPPTLEAPSRPADWTRHLFSRGRQLSVTMQLLRDAVPGLQRLEDLWRVSLLHPTWQAPRVNELQQRPLAAQLGRPQLLWADTKALDARGSLCPHLLLDEMLTPTAATVPHHAGDGQAVEQIDLQLGCQSHLFSKLPDAAALHWLRDRRRSWSATISRRSSVHVSGEPVSAAGVAMDGEDAGEYAIVCRSRPARLQLRKLPCSFEARGVKGPERFGGVAWSGVALCERSGTVLQRRYWLASQEQAVDGLLLAQFATDGYAPLTRHALQGLRDMPGFQHCASLSLLVAGGLASTAMRIERSPMDRDAELREQLMAVLGGKRACTTRSLVDALAYLFVAQELLVPARTN